MFVLRRLVSSKSLTVKSLTVVQGVGNQDQQMVWGGYEHCSYRQRQIWSGVLTYVAY